MKKPVRGLRLRGREYLCWDHKNTLTRAFQTTRCFYNLTKQHTLIADTYPSFNGQVHITHIRGRYPSFQGELSLIYGVGHFRVQLSLTELQDKCLLANIYHTCQRQLLYEKENHFTLHGANLNLSLSNLSLLPKDQMIC